MHVIEMKWWNSHWWQRQAGPSPQWAYQTKSHYLRAFQLTSELKK